MDTKSRDFFQNAIIANEAYQHLLQEQLANVDVALKKNAELQTYVNDLISKKFKRNRKSTLKGGFSQGEDLYDDDLKKSSNAPYFIDPDGQLPPDNDDTLLKRQKNIVVFHKKFKKWSHQEISSLKKAVCQQLQQIQMSNLYEKYKDNSNMSAFDQELERIRHMGEEELEVMDGEIDWERIAKSSLPGRTALDCKIKWNLDVKPGINCGDWTKDEDVKLKQLFEQLSEYELQKIAETLGTKRSPLQCLMRYKSKLDPKMVKSKWSEKEDEQLREAIQMYGEKNWQQVAHRLEGRTGQQCLHRWLKTLNPNIKRGKWTAEEDRLLALSVAAYGSKNWVNVQKNVPGRTDVQCRERWMNVLNPEIKSDIWTDEEDEKLREAVETYGEGKWSKVAQECAPRTDNQCWRRWKTLNRNKSKKKVEKKKTEKRTKR